jgi:hypothetical protein
MLGTYVKELVRNNEVMECTMPQGSDIYDYAKPDNIMDNASLEKFLGTESRSESKAGAIGDIVAVTREKNNITAYC